MTAAAGPVGAGRMVFSEEPISRETDGRGNDVTTTIERVANELRFRFPDPSGNMLAVDVELDKQLDLLQVLSAMDRKLNWHWQPHRKAERDSYRKSVIRPVVQALVRKADELDEDPAALMLSFTQGIPYQDRGWYQQWPTQTLLTLAGDCSDSAVLYAALLEQYQAMHLDEIGKQPLWLLGAMGQGSSWPRWYGLLTSTHLTAAIRVHKRNGTRWTYEGESIVNGRTRYFFAETTGFGFPIGEKPPGNVKWIFYPDHFS